MNTMQITLEPIHRSDLATLSTWIASYAEMVQWSGPWNFEFPLDEQQLAQFFLADTTADGLRRMQYKAVDTQTGEMVGQIGFSRIWDKTNGGHLGPVVVSPQARSRGIGLQMTKKILQIGFEEEQLHRIELVVFSFNAAAIRCYENAGFQIEGLMREIVQVDGTYWDWNVMSILHAEWQSREKGCGPLAVI